MKRRTVREAIFEALKKAGKPLSSKEIYQIIVEHDLFRFNAERPVDIVKSEIRRHCVGIDFPTAQSKKYFQVLIDGTYWFKDKIIPGDLKPSQSTEKSLRIDSENLRIVVDDLKSIHSKHSEVFKRQVLGQLKKVHPKAFEVFSKRLLEEYGFIDMVVTQYSKDGGIDGHGKLKVGMTHLHVAFQCKRWHKTSVGRTEIDKFRGAIQGDYEQGIIFTTSQFSKDALNATRKNGAVPIILIDGLTMIDVMIDKKFGVDVELVPVYINALDRVLTDE